MSGEETGATAMPPLDFNTFVMSLATSALAHMGQLPEEALAGNPMPPVNLPLAKQTIDLIGMLEGKTKGNLSGEEERLISQVLSDLRLRFVSAQQ